MNKESIAKKAAALRTNTMVRISAEQVSGWIYNVNGKIFIGYPDAEPVPGFLNSAKPKYDLQSFGQTHTIQML